MLQVKNLNILHKKDLHSILTNFQLVLNKGDKAVIIGEEGNGKSTLLKWIFNPNLVEDYVEAEGECIFAGEKLGYLPQELPASEEGKSLYEFFCEEASFWEQSPKQLASLANNLHLPVDFFYREQLVGTLSGGEKVKAQLARLVCANPTIFLLDEPSNDLDLETLEWLEHWIGSSQQTILFISHDETLIEQTANVVIHLEQIRRKTISRYTVAHIPYRQYIAERENNFNNQAQQAKNERREKQIREEKLRRLEQKVEHDLRATKNDHVGRLLAKKMKAVKSMGTRYERKAQDMTQMPESEDAIFFKFGQDIQIPNGKVILDFSLKQLYTPPTEENDTRLLAENIFLHIRGQQKVCIIGQNGVGKTTLLRLIADELLRRTDIHAIYMPQNYEDALDMEKTPVEFLSVVGNKEECTRIRTYLGSMKYTADEMSHPIRELSGGQKAKTLLLKMSLSGANVLILDEPTRNFSPLSAPVIREVLRDYQGVILSISHDRKYIREVCDIVYRLTSSGLEKVE